MHQDRPLPVLLADHGHPVASSVDRQVARHTQGLQQGDTVAGDIERSRTVHFTHHRHLVVQELYRHDRVFDQVSLYQALLDHLARYDAAVFEELFIVSSVAFVKGGELAATVEPATGEKCPRCWNFRELGGNANHPQVCKRCGDALDAIGFTEAE